jgi:hypothetical protein
MNTLGLKDRDDPSSLEYSGLGSYTNGSKLTPQGTNVRELLNYSILTDHSAYISSLESIK